MPKRLISRQRRLFVGAISFWLLNPQKALAGTSTVSFDLYPKLLTYIRPAIQHLRNKQLLLAAGLLHQANQIIEENPQENWPWRRYVLPLYGYTLLELGRIQQATETLQLAFLTHNRIASENLPRFKEVIDRLDEGQGVALVKAELNRQLLSSVRLSTQVIPSVEELLYDQSVGSADLVITLARTYHAEANDQAILALYGDYLSSAERHADSNNAATIVTREYRLFKLGALLVQTKKYAQAEDAFRRALDLNTQRFHIAQSAGTATESIWGIFIVRRKIVSALLEISRITDALESKAEMLLGHLIASKNGATRYSETLRKRLNTSTNLLVSRLCTSIHAVEDEMAGLPSTMDGIKSFLHLAARQGLLISDAVQALRISNLLEIPEINASILTDVRKNLGSSAIVGFMLYSTFSDASSEAGSNRYIRYSLSSSEIQLTDVGTQRTIEQEVYAFRSKIMAANGAETSNAGQLLCRRLLSNLPKTVHSAKEWIIHPDGALTLLPFEALPGMQGEPLIVERAIRYVTSLPRESRGEHLVPALTDARILANPDYSAALNQKQETDRSKYFRLSSHAVENGQVLVTPLPETAIESQAVADSLKKIGISVQQFERTQATVDTLRSSKSPQLLHIAAHGTLLQSKENFGPEGLDAIDLILPGRRAALILSKNGAPDILLAKDIARLPLEGTQLVVLSACDTGNGDIVPGEGIASLRRAVELAGAKSSITSIWPVPSKATVDLMKTFYHLLGESMPVGEALRQAKLELINQGRLPVEWAGFLFTGPNTIIAVAST